MTSLISIPETTVPAGPLGPFVGTPPGESFGASIEMARVGWPAGLSVPVSIDGSNDGGATWFNIGATEITDGFVVDARAPLASSLFKFYVRWPEVGGVPRVPGKVRVTANGNKAFRTAATVSVF